MITYVFDTNIFVNLQRRQPLDVYPSVWGKISELMEKGIVISSSEVYDEIAIGSDSLVEWAKKRKKYFLPSEINLQQKVRDILSNYRSLVEGGKKRNSADPFVIALAQEKQGIVVTEETRTREMAAPKIPDVCDAYDIKCMNFVEFSREMNLTF